MKPYQTDIASLLLRIALGVMFLAHGLTKLLVFTPNGTAQYFESLGLPGFVGYLTIAFEIGGGVLLLLGVLTRMISSLAVIQMIVISFIHSVNGWSFSNAGGGWEYPAFMALSAFSLALLGSGRFSVLFKGTKYE
ncbi:DoxX family protein [Gilliamella sp. Pas-s25]|uniref:DoxX family protein n=1 Tax=Gilliamella sp. Pas-s25 TaxID=2687310 RepID=UPI00135D144D|nr:DoxX family protein [Gilliamella sp. Pas-s25]MWP61572.1 DoxX family membrane protein [Gilliamella sp. Pas-s25]